MVARTARAAPKPAAKKAAPAKTVKKKVRAEVEDEVDEAIAEETGTKKRRSGEMFDPMSFYTQTVDDISRRQGVDSDLMEAVKPMSTGTLALDILEGGGIRPSMYVHSGWEQTCKTTGAFSIMGAAINAKVPIISLWDYEGSTATSKGYIANIFKTLGVKVDPKLVFGKKDKATGKWLVRPTVRYNAETKAEKFFDWLAETLRSLPDKKFVADQWWFVFEDNKVNKAKIGQFVDATMNKKYGRGLWVPAEDGNLQAFIIVDSLPAMNPSSNDKEEADNSLGVHARMFAKHLPRIKGNLASKMVALLGINQLREIPMAMYGPKEKEACGQAVRFNSDVRLWWAARSSGMPFNPKFDTEERLEIEKSWDGRGKDRYKYFQVTAKKNKLSTGSGRKMWIRLWVQDTQGEARGFDPVFDVMQHLKVSGQVTGKRAKFILDLDGLGPAKKPVDWMTMKQWILGDRETKVDICTKLGYKPMDIRKYCFKQIESGTFDRLLAAAMSAAKAADDEVEDE